MSPLRDSLQRITGVQITRSAGEGGTIAIRGLPQVGTTMNGEVFLSATTIDTSGANFGDSFQHSFSLVLKYLKVLKLAVVLKVSQAL